MTNAVDQARQLLQHGDVQGAARMLKQAEERGDAIAARELGYWLLEGRVVRRNLAEARNFFERAAKLGDQASAGIARAFIAAGVGGPPDWQKAMALLRAAASSDVAARAQLDTIAKMRLAADGGPDGGFDSRALCDSPEVRLFPAFFSREECEFLVRSAQPKLQASVVVDPHSGREVPNPIRTSRGAGFPFIEENPAIHALNRRIAAASGTDVRAGEPLQVLSYAPGQQYREHSDALPNVAPGQQRVITFLVYLDEDYEGGETVFPKLGIEVRGRTGDGLMFRNAADDGTPDPRAIHAGLPVTRGVKHLASRWIRAAPLALD